MSSATYTMNRTWNQSQVPQLEHEYLDSDLGATDQSYGQQIQSQQSSFPSFNTASFPGRTTQGFSFQMPQLSSVNQMYDTTYRYDQTGGLSDPSLGAGQYGSVASTSFGITPSTSFQQSHTGLQPVSTRNQQGGYGFDERSHENAGLHLGATDGVAGAIPPGVYVSPPPTGQFTPRGVYPPSPGQNGLDHPQSNGQRANEYLRQEQQYDSHSEHLGVRAPKRQHVDDGLLSEDLSADPDGDSKDPSKGKSGACARCKGLKVKCEFRSGDRCRRCLSGNHECVIPGKKKRRAPPKREYLLNQIQEQASQIQELMVQLERANRRNAAQAHPSGLPSPTLSSNTDLFSTASVPTGSDLASSEADVGNTLLSDHMSKSSDVMDWIAKARESLQQFGGYINMGGSGPARGLDEGSDDEYANSALTDEDDMVKIAVEGEDHEDYTEIEEAVSDRYASGDEGTTVEGSPYRKGTRSPSGLSARGEGTTGGHAAEASPFGLMAKLSLIARRRRPSRTKSEVGGEKEKAPEVGIPNNDYFKTSPAPERPIIDERQQHPHIFRNGIVRPDEVESLFKIYWNYMNLSTNLLDPELYTPQATYWRSPFLFTVLCAVASRFYKPRPELYQHAMHYARLAAGTALIGGRLSVESVQAYVLLMLYPVPCRRWEEDRTWIYLGLAIRIATSLNLDKPVTVKPKNEQHARELLNRTRTWLAVFNLDRSAGSQYGKPAIIPNTDYVANQSGEWWNSSLYNMKGFDVHVAGYNAELRVIAQFGLRIRSDSNNPSGINESLDIAQLALETDDKLARLWDHWFAIIGDHNDPNDTHAKFRTGLLRLAYSYARLTALSFGFQSDFAKKSGRKDIMLERSLRAATDVLKAYLEEIASPSQKIYLRHGPDAQSVFVTFASTFLIKLLQPKYASYLSRQQRVDIRDLVGQLVDVMSSEEVAVDDRHCPKLYARFLRGLLATPIASVDHPTPRSPAQKPWKAKSVSPASRRAELYNYPLRESMSNPSSARPSASPPPNGQYAQMQNGVTDGLQLTNELPNGFNGYFTPLPFESELLQSIQTLTDPTGWQDIMHGFSWMQQSDTDAEMNSIAMGLPISDVMVTNSSM